jgi:dolichol-phosphate mannosyltransferase
MIFVVLPVYNEEQNVRNVIMELRASLKSEPYQIIAVNDGSSDKSLEILREIQADDMAIESSTINMNVGQVFSSGIGRALELSNDPNDVVIIMESDRTSSVSVAVQLVEAIQSRGDDVVIASRYRREGGFVNFPFWRVVLSRTASSLMRYCFPVSRDVCDYTIFFRAYRIGILRRAVEVFGRYGVIQSKGFPANAELLIKLALLTSRISEIPFVYDYGRKKGRSKIRILRTIGEYFVVLSYLKSDRRKVERLGLRRNERESS